MVPEKGLVAWFKSSELGTTGNGGNKWVSAVGKFTAKPISGTVQTVTSTGHGAKGPVRMVTGSTAAAYTFGNILADHYTICSLTRYTGKSRSRVLQGTRSNWLHGHWSGRAGVAHYDGWIGGYGKRVNPADNWVLLCGTSQTVLLNGKKIGTRKNHIKGGQSVSINSGRYGNEKSDFGVAEVITWNRALSEKEMQDASTYLQNILDGRSTPRICCWWW